ncbi:MAG: dihydrolipoyl dehydrogenase [Bacteroidales bacterium]|nr:MAG: dihydrolipoyl dehydrogenase [Bacteroidales bacterium]
MLDLAIIGGGPAGYTAAERAVHLGLKVVIFEKNSFGGVCLNEGCIPTKTLLYSAKLYKNAQSGKKYGFSAENISFDYAKIVSRKNKIVRKLNAGIRAKMGDENITVINGNAIVDKYLDNKIVISCDGEKFEAKKLLICSGSQVSIPPIKGVDNVEYITSKEALELKEIPKSIAIVGGGVIGMEFAGLFNTFGTKVSVVEMAEEILPPVDSEISALLRTEYEKEGVDFYLGAKVTELQNNKLIFTDKDGNTQSLDVEKILLCVGRKPVLEGLEALALKPFRNGIEVDETMQTSIPNVYAAGDITAYSMLAHTAVREAEVAVNNIAGIPDNMSYKAVPSVVYTNPEVAGVGKTEDELKADGRKYSVKKLPMTFSGRFVAENEGSNGLCKLIFDENNIIIGCHMIGNPSSEIIVSSTIAIEQQMSDKAFEKIIFPHPSVGEIIKESLFV